MGERVKKTVRCRSHKSFKYKLTISPVIVMINEINFSAFDIFIAETLYITINV